MIQKKYNSPIPENYDSEIVVLSSVITNYDSLLMLMEFSEMPEELFFNSNNKYIFRLILDLFKSKIKIDITIIKAQVNKDNGEITDKYLLELLQAYSTFNLEWHLKLLHDLAERRKLLPEIENLFEAVKTHKIDYNEFISKVYDIKNKYELNENIYTDLQVLAHQNFNDFVNNEIFYKTGIDILDEYLVGFFNQQVITIAGAPGAGKTTLGLQFVTDIGNGLIISQEMSKGELYKKLISRYAEVDSRKLIKGLNKCNDNEMDRILKAIHKVKENMKLKVVDKRLSFNQILNTIRKICRSHEIKIIMIDYLQLLTIDNYKHNRTGEYEVMTREIKGLAKELNKPIILISQLVKDGYDKQPTLADLRGSGSIAQDADIILFTWQNSIIIGKSRGAKTGQVDNIKLIGEHSYFLDVTGNKWLYA